MAIELNRTLFIGLGGAGVRTILETKSMFLEKFGEIPPCVGFLGIDTDAYDYEYAVKAQEYEVSLDAHEMVTIGVHPAYDLYHANQDAFSWMSARNRSDLIYLGIDARQIRSNGRFVFENNYPKIVSAVKNAFDRIKTTIIWDTDRWALNDCIPPQVYVVFSLCGGTGSGIFINMGYLLRDVLGECVDLQAYAIGPGAFDGCGDYAVANAYAAMLDMDYIMTNVNLDHPLELQGIYETKFYGCKPYDFFSLIDNLNSYGVRYNRDQLHTMIAKVLFNLFGTLGSWVKADFESFKCHLTEGYFNIDDKEGWVMGHGLCEIKIDRKKLQKTFALKAAMNLVGDILGGTNTNINVGDEINRWIYLFGRIGADQISDSLYDFSMLPQSVIASGKAADARLESDTWVKDGEDNAIEKINTSYAGMLDQIQQNINANINTFMSMYGLNGTKTLFEGFQLLFAVYEEEMKYELEHLRSVQSVLTAHKDDVIESWRKTIFGGARKFRPILQDVQYELLKNKVDIMRHTKAQQFYLVLKEKLSSLDVKLNASIVMFNSVSEAFTKRMAALSAKKDVNPFVIDLSGKIPVSGNHPNNTVGAFINSNPDLLGMASLATDEVTSKIEAFTSSLTGAAFSTVSVEDEILRLSEDEITELFTDAMRKASVMLEIQGKGLPIKAQIYAYISLPSGVNSRLTKIPEIYRAFVSNATHPTYVPSSSDSSILIYLISGGYPVFQIETIVKHSRTYEDQLINKCLSFDMAIERKILDEHFGFEPNSKRDDVLEMWVKGFIFEMIKKNGNEYVLDSPQLATSMTGKYSMRLPEGVPETERRAYAYEDFTDHKNTLQGSGELKEKIREQEMALGRNELLRKYKEFAEIAKYNPAEYLRRFAGLSLETVDNNNPAYEKTRTLLNDELKYCRDQLVKSVDTVF